mgnify:CR=1 FL=1
MLVVAGTPIGDPTDASPRLRDALATADVVAADLARTAHDLPITVNDVARSFSGWFGSAAANASSKPNAKPK